MPLLRDLKQRRLRGRDLADREPVPALVVGILDARDDRRPLGLPRQEELLVLVERTPRGADHDRRQLTLEERERSARIHRVAVDPDTGRTAGDVRVDHPGVLEDEPVGEEHLLEADAVGAEPFKPSVSPESSSIVHASRGAMKSSSFPGRPPSNSGAANVWPM